MVSMGGFALFLPLLALLLFIPATVGRAPKECLVSRFSEKDPLLGPTGKKCLFCSRMVVIQMESVQVGRVVYEEAGCADHVDTEVTPPGLECTSHLGKNSTTDETDIVLYFSGREDRELVAKRCCENIDGRCNGIFQVRYPQKYLFRQIKRSPPHLFFIIMSCVFILFYYFFRLHRASDNRLTNDATKEEQLKMHGYRDDPLDPDVIESKTKVEEPRDASARARILSKFDGVLRAIFEIMYYLNPKKYNSMWTQALPKMRRDAAMRGLKPPGDKMPNRFTPPPERKGPPFFELQKRPNKKGIFSDVIKYRTLASKVLGKQHRPYPSYQPDMISKMIEHGPYEYPFKAAELFDIFEKAKDVFAQDQTVLQLKSNQIVVGDIRGRYLDLFRIFNTFGWPPRRSYLFLGGVIENGEDQSLECMALLSALKCAMPVHIFLLRGVGETVPFLPGRRFQGSKGESIGNSLARLCNTLPVAAVVNSRILATHSGVTTHFKGKSRLNNLVRPFSLEDMTEAGRRIIFAVPETNCRMFRMRPHEKNGEVFGAMAVQKTLASMKLDLLIRSKSPIPDGYALHWDNKVLSIWSSLTQRRAAVVEVTPQCRLVLHILDTNARFVKAPPTEGQGESSQDEKEDSDSDSELLVHEQTKEGEDRKGKRDEKAENNLIPKEKEEVKAPKDTTDDLPSEKTGEAGSAKNEKKGAAAAAMSIEKTARKGSKEPARDATAKKGGKPKAKKEADEEVEKTQNSGKERTPVASSALAEQTTQSIKARTPMKREEEAHQLAETPDASVRSQLQTPVARTPKKEDEGTSTKGEMKKLVKQMKKDMMAKRSPAAVSVGGSKKKEGLVLKSLVKKVKEDMPEDSLRGEESMVKTTKDHLPLEVIGSKEGSREKDVTAKKEKKK